MSKKKNNEQFNNPFSALEGLSVSSPEKVLKKPAAAPPVPVTSEPVEEAESSEVDFFAEMTELGVREIEPSGMEKQAPERGGKGVSPADKGKTPNPGTGSGVARARRGKQLKRGEARPEAELDLHGVTVAEVEQKVAWFLENSQFYGFEAVRIITGRGSHSGEGPVLRPLVEAYLDGQGRDFVVEWMRAPQKQGGAGAIVAFLRQK